MPTPKPGQIRCPTCHRPTPMAAFCTQCGAAIPSSVQARPRGMDRQELDARIRQRRPGEARLRRGMPVGEEEPGTGYVPFQPVPEDARAMREHGESTGRVDNTSPDFDRAASPPPAPAPFEPRATPGPVPAMPDAWDVPRAQAGWQTADDAAVGDEADYEEQDEGYPYPYADEAGSRGGGSNLLPVIGFVVLAILALGVGAALAGMLGGGGVATASATPSATESAAASTQGSVVPSESADQGSSKPEPTDGPVTFPDGAELSIQPCGSGAWQPGAVGRPNEDPCQVDGSSISGGNVWAFVNFARAAASDALTVQLVQDGQVQDEQKFTIGSKLSDCGTPCNGLTYGAQYAGLLSGDYKLVLQRNGKFADSATFTVK